MARINAWTAHYGLAESSSWSVVTWLCAELDELRAKMDAVEVEWARRSNPEAYRRATAEPQERAPSQDAGKSSPEVGGGAPSCDSPGPDEVWVELSDLGAPIGVWADPQLAANNYSEHCSALIRYAKVKP